MTLPQNVEDALKLMDGCISTLPDGNKRDWQTIRVHLLSQEAEIARLQSGIAKHVNSVRDLQSRLAAANERLEAAERDAARYRWLRGGDSRLAVCDEDTSYYLEQLDAIVDAATQEGEG
jgi:hypothetical protein